MQPIWACDSDANCCWYSGDEKDDSTQCFQGEVPLLAVNAFKAEYVEKAVAWAAQKNIALSVKSTGHDFQGRSTNKDTLMIWVHNMKEVTYIPEHEGCYIT